MKNSILALAAALCSSYAAFGQATTGPGDAPIQVVNHPTAPVTQFLQTNAGWQALANQSGALLISNSEPRKLWRLRIGKNSLLLLLLFALFLVWPHRTRSQTTAATTSAPQALPQRVIYGEAFKHIVFLDVQADLADQRGGDGHALRNFYQTRAGLTPAESALLKSTAHSAVTAIQAVNQQIQVVIVTYRAQFHNGKWPANTPLPPLPDELRTLQTQKDNLILNGLAAIQSGLAPDRFRQLDAFVQKDIAPHITLDNVKLPPRPTTAGPLPAMQPVRWK